MNPSKSLSSTSLPFEGLSVIMLDIADGCRLWDVELGAHLERLEERLEGAHVTFATLKGCGPRLVDALRAAEFLGSRRVFVVVPRSVAAVPWHGVDSRLPVEVLWTGIDDDIPNMVSAVMAKLAA